MLAASSSPRMFRFATLGLALFAAPALAQDLGISVRASTLGAGADVAVAVAPTVNVRGTVNVLAFQHGGVLDEAMTGVSGLTLDYDADLGLGSVGALIDWHPFGNTFHVTAGALVNLNGGSAEIWTDQPFFSDEFEREFSAERVGTLRTEVSYEQPVAPYLGVGVGDLTAGRFGLTAELGMAYVGPPTFEMSGTGLIGGTADPANVATLNAGFDSFRLHPVASIGFKTAFGR